MIDTERAGRGGGEELESRDELDRLSASYSWVSGVLTMMACLPAADPSCSWMLMDIQGQSMGW